MVMVVVVGWCLREDNKTAIFSKKNFGSHAYSWVDSAKGLDGGGGDRVNPD